MATLATLVVKLLTDTTEFTQAMDSAAKKWQATSERLTTTGKAMMQNVTLPLVGLGGAALKLASDLEETRNKTSVVFGDMAEDIYAFADNAAIDLGMSSEAAMDYASTFGSMISNAGIMTDKSAEMSKVLTQMISDYGSFHNLSPGEAFEKIKAAMVGSSEPMDALGKNMRMSAVQAYAMENGITANANAMTQSELILARYGLLLQQSQQEMGDFANTSESVANSTKITTGLLQDTLAEFGKELLPIAKEFLGYMIKILQYVNSLPESTKKTIVKLLAVAAALGPVLFVAGKIVGVFSSLAGLFGTGGALSGAATFISSSLVPALTGAGTAIGGVLAGISAPVWALIAAVGALVLAIVLGGKRAKESLFMLSFLLGYWLEQTVKSIGEFKNKTVEGIQNTIADVKNWVGNFFSAGAELMNGFVNGVSSRAQALVNSVTRPILATLDWVKKALGISSPSKVFAQFGEQMMLGMAGGIRVQADQPRLAAAGAVSGTMSTLSSIRGGGRSLNIGSININGPMSEAEKENLRLDIRKIFDEEFEEAFA